ncbi:MAG: membrane protein insertion efficiency factor YidD [Clostridia bacterium]|nr:membrane protein insertion efficiency factor YidD [Clostridia bacterium]
MDNQKREDVTVAFAPLARANAQYLRRTVFKPYAKRLCMRMILFYQRRISKHTCMFRPTCSEYTLQCIQIHGVILGILLGSFRILRCHPWTKPGQYDPPPERYFKKKWLL